MNKKQEELMRGWAELFLIKHLLLIDEMCITQEQCNTLFSHNTDQKWRKEDLCLNVALALGTSLEFDELYF